MISTYDARFVVFSVVIAAIAFYTALDLAGRVTLAMAGVLQVEATYETVKAALQMERQH